VRKSRASGKEEFDYAKWKKIYRGSEFLTMAQFARHFESIEPWEDSS
jgi:hypothetical protein